MLKGINLQSKYLLPKLRVLSSINQANFSGMKPRSVRRKLNQHKYFEHTDFSKSREFTKAYKDGENNYKNLKLDYKPFSKTISEPKPKKMQEYYELKTKDRWKMSRNVKAKINEKLNDLNRAEEPKLVRKLFR